MDRDSQKIESLKLRAKELNEVALRIFYSNNSDWSTCKSAGGICISKLPQHSHMGRRILDETGSKAHVFKGECVVPMSRQTAKILIHPDGPYRVQWEPLSYKITKILEIDETSCVYKHDIRPQMMGLVVARESIDICSFYSNENMSWVVLGSTEYPHVPQTDKTVRVWSHLSAFFIRDTQNPDICEVTSLMHTDLKIPVIPLALIEMSLPGSNFLFLQELIKAPKIVKKKADDDKAETENRQLYWGIPATTGRSSTITVN